MRTALLSLSLLVAACNDDNNRLASLESTTSDLTAIRAELAALRAQVGALPAMPDVAPLADRLTALEAQVTKLSAARKVPHLVSRDTGVDYGVSVDGALAAWNEELQAVIDYSKSRIVSFSLSGCDGEPLFDANTDLNTKFNRYLFLPDGRLARLNASARVNVPNGSTLEPDGTCTNHPSVNGFPAVLAKFSTPRAAPESLDIELR